MTKPLPKVRLKSPLEEWMDAVVCYTMQRDGSLVMTLLIKGKRVKFQLAPDGVWRRRIKRRGCNYWRRAIPWDALQCRLAYNSYRSVFPKAPVVDLTHSRL